MIDDTTTGIALARAYHRQIVGPLLASRFPGLPYAAGRLGPGSDVLGLDDARSRDHDWGLRLQLFVADDAIEEVSASLDQALPDTFDGLPTRFALTGETRPRHHVDVNSVPRFLRSRLGFDPRAGVSTSDWLSLTGQAVLEVVAGPVFVDADGELGRARQALDWYPDDIWRYVLACDWARLAEELPLMGRAAELGDDAGARIIGARLTQVAMHLAFLLERRWPPYAKWFGTLFAALPRAGELQPHVDAVLAAGDADARQLGLAALLERLLTQQNELGLTDVARATVPFWDRPFLHPDPAIVTQLLDPITDEEVRRLPPGRGSVEQRTDNPALLTDPQARRRTVQADET
ncbi:DUF4037 domain-containing protein [Leifsonia sp. NPDC056824]|uniref:DUF4037 domain-containing protein n=1 Tax=Leifsonia sp. NPDC056824 TaxID=3345953 RepID=UPI00368017C5